MPGKRRHSFQGTTLPARLMQLNRSGYEPVPLTTEFCYIANTREVRSASMRDDMGRSTSFG